MEEKNGFDWEKALTIFGFGFPLILILAPSQVQKELIEYAGKLVAFFIGIGAIYFIWQIIKDKRKK